MERIIMDHYFEYSDQLNAPLEAFCHQSTPENFPILPHWHYFIEIIYLLEGQVLVTCEDHVYALHPGDLIYFPPQCLHTIDTLPPQDHAQRGYLPERSASDCRLLLETADPQINPEHGGIYPISIHAGHQTDVKYYVLKFDLGSLPAANRWKTQFNLLSRHAYAANPAHILFLAPQIHALPVRELMAYSIQEMQHRNYGYDAMVSAAVTTLLTDFSRIWLSQGIRLDDILTAPQNANQAFEQITEYIEMHYNESLRVKSLADHCGMSYSYFAKSFRETYGRSCKEYIEFVRINKVTDLLLFTNLDLNYISQETGFADCSHLIRTFKKHKGCTPKQWKRKVGNHNETYS